MDAISCIKTRRSIRRYTDEPLDRALIEKIAAAASMAPSWKNSQTVRYYLLDGAEKDAFARRCCAVHPGNLTRALSCAALAALVTVRGVSGYEPDGAPSTPLGSHWESFDAGIAAQTFCLAAHALGVGTLIMGIYNPEEAGRALSLPEDRYVAALIALGRPAEDPAVRPRKGADELLTWVK